MCVHACLLVCLGLDAEIAIVLTCTALCICEISHTALCICDISHTALCICEIAHALRVKYSIAAPSYKTCRAAHTSFAPPKAPCPAPLFIKLLPILHIFLTLNMCHLLRVNQGPRPQAQLKGQYQYLRKTCTAPAEGQTKYPYKHSTNTLKTPVPHLLRVFTVPIQTQHQHLKNTCTAPAEGQTQYR